METNTLYYKVKNDIPLTDKEKETFYKIVSSGCREKNKNRLYNIIYRGWIYKTYGIYERIIFENEECHYIAGQSYPDEIRVIRDLLLNF